MTAAFYRTDDLRIKWFSPSGYGVFSHPEICSGDQSRISLLATMFRNLRFTARKLSSVAKPMRRLGDPPHGPDKQDGHHGERPPDSLSRLRDRGVWLSHESTNRKRYREIGVRARRNYRPHSRGSAARNM